MITSIHQPSYFPWLGLLSKIGSSDLFICLDGVQLADRAYQHRNIFLTNGGEVKYLTLNVEKKGYRDLSIREIKLSSDIWQKKHSEFIKNNYKKHLFFDEIYPIINPIFESKYTFLIDVLTDSMSCIFKLFDLNVEFVLQSSLDYDKSLRKSDLIINLLKRSKSVKYLSGKGAMEYQIAEDFSHAGLKLMYHSFSHPEYYQKNSKDFKSGLSSLDLLFNKGMVSSREILKETFL